MLAELPPDRAPKPKELVILSASGIVLLYCEHCLIMSRGWAVADDCYFTLPFFCIPVFLLLLSCDVQIEHTKFLRCASTVTFCLHANLQFILMSYFGCCVTQNTMFVIVLIASWLLTFLILKLEKLPHLSWLRYSH